MNERELSKKYIYLNDYTCAQHERYGIKEYLGLSYRDLYTSGGFVCVSMAGPHNGPVTGS